jgi:hypothetical protein
MKPWNVRYHYQTFDQSGTPLGKGDFDYWGSSTKGTKASWRSGDQSYIEWHTADGKELRSGTIRNLGGMEHFLAYALSPGFVKTKDRNLANRPLEYFTTKVSAQPVVCVGEAQSTTVEIQPSTVRGEPSIAIKPSTGETKIGSLDSVSPGYCFDQHAPILIASHISGTVTTLYGENRKFQNHNFAGQLTILYVGAKRVDSRLEDLSEVLPDDAAFTPSPDAQEYVRPVMHKVAPVVQTTPHQ